MFGVTTMLLPVAPVDQFTVPFSQPLAVTVIVALSPGQISGLAQANTSDFKSQTTFGTVIVTVAVEHLVPSILSHILYVNVSVPENPAFGV